MEVRPIFLRQATALHLVAGDDDDLPPFSANIARSASTSSGGLRRRSSLYASSVDYASRRSLASRSSRAIVALTTPGAGGMRWTDAIPNGKFSLVAASWNQTCYYSYSITVGSAVWYDPAHFLLWVSRSVTSTTHVPHARCRTLIYVLCGGRDGGCWGKSANRAAAGESGERWRLQDAPLEDEPGE